MAFNFYEGVTLQQLQKIEREVGPFYYYNTSLLCQTLETINKELSSTPHFHVHYAIKANANPELLTLVRKAGLGVDCVSGGEVQRALEVGFAPKGIVFAGVGKSDREIRTALQAGISCFNVESLPEMEVINELAKQLNVKARLAFRVNPNVDAHTHEKITTGLHENKFGLAMEDLIPAIRLCNELEAVEYVGLHFHIGSQILDLSVYEALCNRINEIQLQLEAEGIHTQSINVGGGLGIDYDHPDHNPIPNFNAYFKVFKDNLEIFVVGIRLEERMIYVNYNVYFLPVFGLFNVDPVSFVSNRPFNNKILFDGFVYLDRIFSFIANNLLFSTICVVQILFKLRYFAIAICRFFAFCVIVFRLCRLICI